MRLTGVKVSSKHVVLDPRIVRLSKIYCATPAQ